MFLSEWREFPSAPCLAGGKKNLMAARVSMMLKSRASPNMLLFSLCNKKRLAIRHVNRPLFPTTLSIPSYDIGKSVGLRTYQHPHVEMTVLKVHLLLPSIHATNPTSLILQALSKLPEHPAAIRLDRTRPKLNKLSNQNSFR